MKACEICGKFSYCHCDREILLNLFILKFFYPLLEVDEYTYHLFITQNVNCFVGMREAFPEEYCLTGMFHLQLGGECKANYIK